MSERKLELRVGALVLAALVVVAALAFALGAADWLEPSYAVFVDFENPGGLRPGAPVRIAGVKVGRVVALHLRGELGARGKRRAPPMHVELRLLRKHEELVRKDSLFYVTAQGVLGEQYLAIEPGEPTTPRVADGETVDGISPPRLDLVLSESYDLLHRAYVAIRHNEGRIAETFDGLHRTLKASGDFVQRNEKKLDSLVNEAEAIAKETRVTVTAARERYVDGPQISRIFNDVERTSSAFGKNADPLLESSRATLSDARKLTSFLSSDAQLARIGELLKDAQAIGSTGKLAVGDFRRLLGRLERGEGTVGALLADETVYDDLQEMLRDVKHNPWKLFWKE